jgi:CRISPR system Cascade subunit CasA
VFNLLTASWLPVVRRHSGVCTIRLAQITDNHSDDPVISIAWPRPDFRIATLEFLIGLLTTACPPTQRAWDRWFASPPTSGDLDAAFAPFVPAFNLDGDGPRFMQDREDLQTDPSDIEQMLIETPGDATRQKNTDLLVHRDQIRTFGLPAAAMALYTLQSWAPAGGAGIRTGLRGGGPLVTLALPSPSPTLWELVWANVPAGGQTPEPDDFPLVFPWLAPTVQSRDATTVTPNDAHPLQAWWGMPRRIRLDFRDGDGQCGLTGASGTVHAVGWRQRPGGANYNAWGLKHPLTPHYRPKPGGEYLPTHPQPGGIGYRDWIGLVLSSKDGAKLPAACIATWRASRAPYGTRPRILAAGFDMDNAKARSFIEAEMPLNDAASDELAYDLVQAAEIVAGLLRMGVRSGLYSAGATVKLDALVLNTARERLWEETEAAFFTALRNNGPDARKDWLEKTLRPTAFRLFDDAVPLAPDADPAAAARISNARRGLGIALHGYGKMGEALMAALGFPPPERKSGAGGRGKKGKKP